MEHQYSNIKNKNIPYAKVGRRVFKSLYDAETYCAENDLDVDCHIQYEEGREFEKEVQDIAKYQKAILRECLNRIDEMLAEGRRTLDSLTSSLENCHYLEKDFIKNRIREEVNKNIGMYQSREAICVILNDLEKITKWHD